MRSKRGSPPVRISDTRSQRADRWSRWRPTVLIEVRLRDPHTGREKLFGFERSPVRIGRNALNNIVIDDAFVSQWHGMIRCDGPVLTYLDLGSTNGSSLEGKRLPRNTAVPLPEDAPLVVSYFQLLATAHREAPSSQGGPSTRFLNWETPAPSGQRSLPAAPAASGKRDSVRLSQCLHIIECFSNAFVALKKGYEEFGAEVGVRPLSGGTPLHRARTGREVVDCLLTSAQPSETGLGDLQAVFADMGIHQLALMEGITQGIRTLLESLDPRLQEGQGGPGFFSRSRSRALWTSYCDRFATLIAEDQALHAEVFGEAFARAYAGVALGSPEPPVLDSRYDTKDTHPSWLL
jgi:hypothetical protein